MSIERHVKSIFWSFRSFAYQCTVQMLDSAATNSDHRAFSLSVRGRPCSRIMTCRIQPKPLGWYLTDRAYCEDIKTCCSVDS